jgi:tetratricopeptide (TPR) repeat protein
LIYTFTTEDEKLFDQILESVRLDRYDYGSLDYFLDASIAYMRAKYKQSSIIYSKLLELEQKNSTLEKKLLYVTIDNLAMSYGIMGQLDDAIKTLEEGLKMDSEYPMFYYSLACAYAEKNDLEKALSYLELVLKFKNNMLEGEPIPNPMIDDSFKKYIDNEDFIKVANKFKS